MWPAFLYDIYHASSSLLESGRKPGVFSFLFVFNWPMSFNVAADFFFLHFEMRCLYSLPSMALPLAFQVDSIIGFGTWVEKVFASSPPLVHCLTGLS